MKYISTYLKLLYN